MPRFLLYIVLCIVLPFPLSVSAAQQDEDDEEALRTIRFEDSTVLQLKEPRKAGYRDGDINAAVARRQEQGLVVPDGRGGVILLPGQSARAVNANVLDARELKLKVRELAAQLVSNLESKLSGHIALPTAFVLQDDFSRSSSFGRYLAEQLYYEFNQRGLRTAEYRLGEAVSVREDGEFLLTRKVAGPSLNERTIYVLGTYYTDGQVVLINSRLIRADGEILRTGQLVFGVTPFIRRMLANSGRKTQEGSLKILDFNTEARVPQAVTAFDQGLDIH
jgi:hypothetical protein